MQRFDGDDLEHTMAFGYNDDHVRHLIEDGKVEISSAIARLVDDLIDNSAIRIHRNWSSLEERQAIVKAATEVALLSVLTCDWSNLDDETRWLFIERKAQPVLEGAL